MAGRWSGWPVAIGLGFTLACSYASANGLGDDVLAAARLESQARLPVAVVDKRHAQMSLFDARGRWVTTTPVLLGAALGEHVARDTGDKAARGTLPLIERTTPAGRYEAVPGRNLRGEEVIWIDHANALAIHRLRPAPARERRAERLASPTPLDNRITLGCVVVDPDVFDREVIGLLGRSRSVVVVLPDDAPEP